MQDSITTKIKYLIEMGCDEVHHSGGTLMQHLVGVHDILVANDAPLHVCDAGLFHSIYGTMTFQHKTTEDREQITELIGHTQGKRGVPTRRWGGLRRPNARPPP